MTMARPSDPDRLASSLCTLTGRTRGVQPETKERPRGKGRSKGMRPNAGTHECRIGPRWQRRLLRSGLAVEASLLFRVLLQWSCISVPPRCAKARSGPHSRLLNIERTVRRTLSTAPPGATWLGRFLLFSRRALTESQ